MIEFIIWIIFGGLVGWVASLLMGTNEQQGVFTNIAVGIVGAMIGGWVAQTLGGEGVSGFNFRSFVVALLGAILLLGVVKLFARRTT